MLGRITGADAAGLTSSITKYLSPPSVKQPLSSTTQAPPAPPDSVLSESADGETPAQLEARLKELMGKERVMLFMKGEPDAPRCGFSRRAVALLRDQTVEFGSFDILSDETVRSGELLPFLGEARILIWNAQFCRAEGNQQLAYVPSVRR